MDLSEPLVSVVVPAFNAEAWLAEAIESVLAQSYPRVELVVVDDGSTDATGKIIRGYGERIRCVSQANAGLASARNAGFLNVMRRHALPVKPEFIYHIPLTRLGISMSNTVT